MFSALARLSLPLRVVLLGAAVLHAVGLSWGMPGSDGWDVDGVAPRDIFPGVGLTYSPGEFFTYPPFHLALVGVLTFPVLLAAVARAGTTAIPVVIHTIIAPVFMTPIAMVARTVAFAMSLGIVVAVAKVTEEIAPGKRAAMTGAAAGALAACGVSFTYYSHVSNLDVPYLFWAWLATLAWVRAIARRQPERLRAASIFAALAIATKDQAYAMFLFAAPVAILAWLAVDRPNADEVVVVAGAKRRRIARAAITGAAVTAGLVLLIDGAFFNPRGFKARLAFLSGPASRDYATYSADAVGRTTALFDTVRAFTWHYPLVVAPLVVVGAAFTLGAAARSRRGPTAIVAACVPLLVALSFTLAFNLVALRVEQRFTLPQMLALAVYGGVGLERLGAAFGARAVWARGAGVAAAAAVLATAILGSVNVDANLLDDPRYDAERWLREHVRPGDVVETHGLSVYMIRFPEGARVERVGPSPVDKRNPMAGVTEVQGPLSTIADRRPRFDVENQCFAGFFLGFSGGAADGRIEPTSIRRDDANADATAFYRGLFGGRLPYRLAHESRIRSTVFPNVDIHASVGCPMYVFERID
jgi:hypothetical protein